MFWVMKISTAEFRVLNPFFAAFLILCGKHGKKTCKYHESLAVCGSTCPQQTQKNPAKRPE